MTRAVYWNKTSRALHEFRLMVKSEKNEIIFATLKLLNIQINWKDLNLKKNTIKNNLIILMTKAENNFMLRESRNPILHNLFLFVKLSYQQSRLFNIKHVCDIDSCG